MRKLFVAIVTVTIFTTSWIGYAAPMSQSDVDQLIEKLRGIHDSKPSLAANFREERHVAMLREPVVNEGRVWLTIPDKIKREIDGQNPSTTVINGKNMFIYYPKFKQVEEYDLEKRPMVRDSIQALTAGLDFRRVTEFYQVEASKEADGYQITLTPKTAQVKRLIKTAQIKIGPDLTPEAATVQLAKGGTVSVSYSNVRREALPPATFEFSPPPGSTVTTPLGS